MGLNLVIYLHQIMSGKSWLQYYLWGKASFLKWFTRPALFKNESLQFVDIEGGGLCLIMYCQHLLNACPGRAVTGYLQCFCKILKGTSDTGYWEATEIDSINSTLHSNTSQWQKTLCKLTTIPPLPSRKWKLSLPSELVSSQKSVI